MKMIKCIECGQECEAYLNLWKKCDECMMKEIEESRRGTMELLRREM